MLLKVTHPAVHPARPFSRAAAAAAFLLLLPALLRAAPAPQPAPLPGDKPIRAWLAARAADLERDFLPDIKTAEDFARAKPQLRADYFDMLGLDPLPERTPLNAVVTGTLQKPGYVVEKLHFQSRPGLYVTANLYRPADAKGRLPAILNLCGHGDQKRNGNKTHYRDHGIWYATHGYAALVLDSLQLGEIRAVHHGTYREGRWWWQSAGYVPSGVECWNGVRALDYLASRPDVDPDRIGITGISGGGAATFWIAAADDRPRAVVPVSGMADLGYYAGEDGVNGHCDCMFLYNRARWNWTTIAALICPRPLLFTNSDADTIFPMSANERVINRLERLYSKCGRSDAVDAMVSVGGHAYRTDLRRAVFEFMNRHLKGDLAPVTDPDAGLKPDGKHWYEGEELRVFPEDKDLPADPLNTRIDEIFVPAAKVAPPAAGGYDAWRRDLLDRLRKKAFAAWPDKAPAGAVSPDAPMQGRMQTEDGIEVTWRAVAGKAGAGARWLVVLNPDEPPDEMPAWAKPVVGESPALLLCTRGIGPTAWTRKNPPNTIERSMALLGGTIEGMRVWDVMAVARALAAGGGDPWKVAGRGSAGILGAYAALYEPSIAGVAAVDPPPSHRPLEPGAAFGPALLNVLRVLDIPEALGCLAPRPLALVNAAHPAFDRTAAIYKAAGAAERLERK
jgi:dienelactone hydrolase